MKLQFRRAAHRGRAAKPKRLTTWQRWRRKYVLLSAPVGSGKSLIGLAAAVGAESAFIVAPQNVLLDQYCKGVPGHPNGQRAESLSVLVGRGQYDLRRGKRNLRGAAQQEL